MEVEKKLVDYICGISLEDIPQEPLEVVKSILFTVFGTTIAGSTEEGCEELVSFYKQMGGTPEASVLIYGGKIPGENAALVNGVMARALDFCDAMIPGLHIGSSAVPSALAAAEMAGGCSGREFLAALAVGIETASRLNLTEPAYDGFDPTGVCNVFSATTVASKILNLSADETWNALALAFNRSGGSFQANIDGSLAVRVIQGWVAQSGIMCARYARTGITGPQNFLEGVYGYYHIFGKDLIDPKTVLEGLGDEFRLMDVIFKKYPSCGVTQGSTEAILNLIEDENLTPETVAQIEVAVPPYAYKLVGHEFKIGDNPRVNAQFNIQYCVASALLRGSSKLEHFEEAAVKDPAIMPLVNKIHIISDPALDEISHTALTMRVLTAGGDEYFKRIDIAPGFPGNPLTRKEHEQRFWDCMDYASKPVSKETAERLISMVDHIEKSEDVRSFFPLLLI